MIWRKVPWNEGHLHECNSTLKFPLYNELGCLFFAPGIDHWWTFFYRFFLWPSMLVERIKMKESFGWIAPTK